MNFTITTTEDEFYDGGDETAETLDGTGLSIREALAVSAADPVSTVTILDFDPALLGSTFLVDAPLPVTSDFIIDGDISGSLSPDVTLSLTNPGGLFAIDASDLTITSRANIDVDLSAQTGFDIDSLLVARFENVGFLNSGDITFAGSNSPLGDRSIVFQPTADGFNLTNTDGASIVTQGRSVIDSTANAALVEFDVVNFGLLEATDDTVRITSGTVLNGGTIRTTGEFTFNGRFEPGFSADAITAFTPNSTDEAVIPREGLVSINNLETGIIDGYRSGVFLNNLGGRVDNAGLITAEGGAIFAGGVSSVDADAVVSIVINNEETGVIERTDETLSAALSGPTGAITLFADDTVEEFVVRNDGIIRSADSAIVSSGPTRLTNSGSIISNSDGAGADGSAFRGAALEDFEVTPSQTSIDPATALSTYDIVSVQDITVNADGTLTLPDGISYPTDFGTIEGAALSLAGEEILILGLIDETATAASGFVQFVRDPDFNLVFPDTIEVPTVGFGVLTVTWSAADGFTVRDSNGDGIFLPPETIDFSDSIVNTGTIQGDIETGLGDDTVDTRDGSLIGDVDLGNGDDTFFGTTTGTRASRVSGGEGNDQITGGSLNERLDGGAGDDIIDGGDGRDDLRGNDGNDTLRGGEGSDRMFGQDGQDTLEGGAGNDVLSGGTDDDSLDGGDGIDQLFGGAGADVLAGGAGVDRLFGQDGNDDLDGGSGRDVVIGGNGDDIVRGGSDVDVLQGGADNDELFGGSGADRLIGGSGDDDLFGETGRDVLVGLTGDDTLDGGDDVDLIDGGAGNDTLIGGAGADRLIGGTGNDVLVNDLGRDILIGGAGADTFEIRSAADLAFVADFENGVDRIDITDFGVDASALSFVQLTGRVRVDVDGNAVAFLIGEVLADIDADDFILGSTRAAEPIAVDDTKLDTLSSALDAPAIFAEFASVETLEAEEALPGYGDWDASWDDMDLGAMFA